MVKREIYLNQLQRLANGDADRKEASEWAVKEERRNDIENVDLNPEDQEILDCLQICTALDEHGNFLYKPEDFKTWYLEYRDTPNLD